MAARGAPLTSSDAGGREVVVEIDSLAPGGDAVGRQRDPAGGATASDGRATFVPLAAPGERVRARLWREKGRVAWGELVAVERPSPTRVAPPCPLFGICGGCQWQHVTLEAQRDAKRAIVARALQIPDAELRPAGPPFGYRDRAKLSVGAGGALGFRARRSHAIVDLGMPPSCPLLGPALARVLPALSALAAGLPPGAELEVQAGAEGVHVNVIGAGSVSAVMIQAAVVALTDAGVVGIARDGVVMTGAAAVDVAEPGGPPLPVPAGGFAQAGRTANAALVAAVMEAVGRDPGVVMELYAGSGNFTRHLLARATAVHASDGDAVAVARGRRNVPTAAWAARPQDVSPDTVVLDPPRDGADATHLAAAARARRRIVYVSCDPQTLGRDARSLQAAGFTLVAAVALDLMPQTFHVEVVATFDHRASSLDRARLLP